jgi:hypothetical protein
MRSRKSPTDLPFLKGEGGGIFLPSQFPQKVDFHNKVKNGRKSKCPVSLPIFLFRLLSNIMVILLFKLYSALSMHAFHDGKFGKQLLNTGKGLRIGVT